MEGLARLSEVLDRVVVWVGRIAAWVAIALMSVILFDVITRRFLVLGSTKLQELEWHLHTVLFALCLGFAYIKDAHVRIDLVRERLSVRAQWWLELCGCLFFLIPFCLVVLYFGADWWQRSYAINEGSSSATGLPYRWIIKAVLPIGFVFLLLATVTVVIRKLIELFGTEALRQRVSQVEYQEAEPLMEPKETEHKGPRR